MSSESEGAGPVVGLILLLGIGVLVATFVFAFNSYVLLTIVDTVPAEDYDESYQVVGVGENSPNVVEDLIVSEEDSIRSTKMFDYSGSYEYEGTVYIIEKSEHFSLLGFDIQYA